MVGVEARPCLEFRYDATSEEEDTNNDIEIKAILKE